MGKPCKTVQKSYSSRPYIQVHPRRIAFLLRKTVQNGANAPLGFGALGKPNGLGGPVSNSNGAGMGEPCKTVQNRAKAITLGCTFMYSLQ